MDFSVRSSIPDTLFALRQAKNARAYALNEKRVDAAQAAEENLPVAITSAPASKSGTQLIAEKQETIDSGYRRTRTYANEDGREFTKVEEFALTNRGARRTVLQQNPSGSITRYEEVLDRQDSGNFRRTQRFQDESGDIATQITVDYTVKDPFVLTQGNAPASYETPAAFLPMRGTQLDTRV